MAETPKNLVGNGLDHEESIARGTNNAPVVPAESRENSNQIVVAAEDVPESSTADGHSNKAAAAAAAVVPGNDDPVVPKEIVPPSNEMPWRTDGEGLNLDETWAIATAMNRRKHMEDFVCVKPGFIAGNCNAFGECSAPPKKRAHHRPDAWYFGLFDGHGGSENLLPVDRESEIGERNRDEGDENGGSRTASKFRSPESAERFEQASNYCADHLHDILAQEWKEAVDKDGWKHRWEAAILRAYERADDAFKDGTNTLERAGSTAVVVVLSDCQIIVGNCGDSRAVLCRGNETIPLTVDHKPNREDELKRITNAGGKVLYTDCERVQGILSMTRAIGDRFLKPWVISVPEVTFTTRSEDDEFLIMASDGLWDVMTSEEAVTFARLARRRLQNLAIIGYDRLAKVVANCLLARAIKKGSRDNISVIFIDLSVPRRRKKPHREPEANQT
ncbi:hypothetical protein ACJRO7_024952 [Eucalyptus globulus]|uniref:protein-serine/threonine phosphatase n=1 Tax=Eucalyptus globulus TaxID=34317 RepID=A0ABD3K7L9_EUCGL